MTVNYPFTYVHGRDIEEMFREKRIYLGHYNKIEGIFREGLNLRIDNPIFAEPYATMPGGNFFSCGSFSYSTSRLRQDAKIGRYCSIALQCEIIGLEHPTDWISSHPFVIREYYNRDIRADFGSAADPEDFVTDRGSITIGNDVWIAHGVRMRRGITIGDGAIVGAGAVVMKDVEPYAIVGGVSAKKIRDRFADHLIERLQRVRWWQYGIQDFGGLPVKDPSRFLDGLEQKIADGLMPYAPPVYNIAEEIATVISQRKDPRRPETGIKT
ncbi:CatB-related O-acetyltransferase [Sphingobium yanoikuyae]|uniref:CatB-related O-acetyltransferase n=1 Tax=Sphingobium yanoikuyae TaxID=13690 RepID=UPI003917F75C